MYVLPDIKPPRKPRTPHRKSDAIRELEQMAFAADCRKHPSVDPKYIAKWVYSDRGANGLTRCVIHFLRLSGCQAERINCVGRYQDNTVVFEDVIGHTRQIGTAKWLPTSGQRGTADISAVIRGKTIKWEVKIKKDRQSQWQQQYQTDIERAGGYYFIVHDFTEFMEQYNSLK